MATRNPEKDNHLKCIFQAMANHGIKDQPQLVSEFAGFLIAINSITFARPFPEIAPQETHFFVEVLGSVRYLEMSSSLF